MPEGGGMFADPASPLHPIPSCTPMPLRVRLLARVLFRPERGRWLGVIILTYQSRKIHGAAESCLP